MPQQLKGVIKKVAERSIYCDIMTEWDWMQGVALAGVTRSHQIVDDQTLFMAKKWLDYHLHHCYPRWTVNSTAAGMTLLHLYQITKNELYYKVCGEIAHYLMNETPRVGKGAIEHTVLQRQFAKQVWADTLFMGNLFLAQFGKASGNKAYTDEAAKQIILHLDYLSAEDGVCYHGWDDINRNHFSEVKWARGNSWIVASTADFLTEWMPEDHSLREEMLSRFNKLVQGISNFVDDKTGFWHTVLDDPTGYLETSASCANAYGMLRAGRYGLLDESYIQLAEKTVRYLLDQKINADGLVLDVSGGTSILDSAEEYNNIITHDPQGYGQGLALLLLNEWASYCDETGK